MKKLPAEKAFFQLQIAEIAFQDNVDKWEVKEKLLQALKWRKSVMAFVSAAEVPRGRLFLTREELTNHELFTTVLTRACWLAWQLDEKTLAQSLYHAALAWADDPNTGGNKRQYEEIRALWRRLSIPWWKRAFIKTPDGISIELLQKGEALPPAEPWLSMQNIGTW